ncbi:hypothetical protein EJ06DRAFT_528794 [Trichodelitschia bisporula]|uniref:Uncharacterized protein n=1 Tax=Trichodelitschia bisporula TaxID=703511 RepID=A0A6G1I0A6_9PEZI|nr:hypothetical protein EJ06DRAFT_528794 [Trichodelitschia bisporula]
MKPPEAVTSIRPQLVGNEPLSAKNSIGYNAPPPNSALSAYRNPPRDKGTPEGGATSLNKPVATVSRALRLRISTHLASSTPAFRNPRKDPPARPDDTDVSQMAWQRASVLDVVRRRGYLTGNGRANKTISLSVPLALHCPHLGESTCATTASSRRFAAGVLRDCRTTVEPAVR